MPELDKIDVKDLYNDIEITTTPHLLDWVTKAISEGDFKLAEEELQKVAKDYDFFVTGDIESYHRRLKAIWDRDNEEMRKDYEERMKE
jgi:hypothetical protein